MLDAGCIVALEVRREELGDGCMRAPRVSFAQLGRNAKGMRDLLAAGSW